MADTSELSAWTLGTDKNGIPRDGDVVRHPHHEASEDATSEEPRAHSSASWTTSQKWLTISSACLVCFAVGLNATGVLAAAEDIAERFDIDLTRFDYTVFLITTWNLGAAIVPLFVLPLMEDFGILPIYYAAYIMFVIFVMVQAVAPNFATLLVARVIAGSFGGILQNSVDGIAADVWGEDIHNRAVSMTLYVFALLGGVTIGPVLGGAIIKTLYWRWILYVQLAMYGAISPYVFLTLQDPRSTQGGRKSKRAQLQSALSETVLRATRMLFTEFVVASFTLLSSFAFGTVFIMTQSIPQVFTDLYGWSSWQTGVVQVAIFVGEIIGVLLCLFQDKVVYPRFAYQKTKSGQAIPEPRLYAEIPCSIFGLAAGFFVYGWTANPSAFWVWPACGLLLIGIGIMVTVQAVSTYVTDCYSSHASSAISAVAFGENVFAAFLPLATRAMYTNLRFHWASSVLGFAGLVLSLAPIVLVVYGENIRARSKLAG